ncbi:MAG TPA: hypothetical protein VK993_00755 [Chthoniobacterales bacterium]|nr:hypothetical protein [Chthoniobacterales bacterium]
MLNPQRTRYLLQVHTVIVALMLVTAASLRGDSGSDPATGAAAFEKMKTLVGSWEATFFPVFRMQSFSSSATARSL